TLKDRVIVITGGVGHLGSAIVTAAASYGATVVIPYYKEVADERMPGADEARGRIHIRDCDLTSTKSIAAFFKKIHEEFGRLDGLVNCAAYGGGAGGKKVADPILPDDESWASGMDGSLSVTFRCIRESVPYLKQSGGGSIVNITSMYGHVSPDPEMYGDTGWDSPAMYGAGKAGTLQLSRYYAANLASDGIRVNSLTPGPFPGAAIEDHPDFRDRLTAKTMLKRYGKAEELAGALLLLLSDAGSYMTGSNITVDGGWTAW
ncbi:MAG: SDR family oxidoreductase, partial [Planctomycetota bacterium]